MVIIIYSDSIQRQTWRRMSLNAFFMLAGSPIWHRIQTSGAGKPYSIHEDYFKVFAESAALPGFPVAVV